MIEAQEMDPAGPNHEELRGGLYSLCEVSDVLVFKLLSLIPWISLSFLMFYFEVCVLIGPYLSLRVSQLNLHLLFEMFIFQRFSLCQKLRVPEADDMLSLTASVVCW